MTLPLLRVTSKSLPLRVLGRGGQENCTCTTSRLVWLNEGPHAAWYWVAPMAVVNAQGFVCQLACVTHLTSSFHAPPAASTAVRASSYVCAPRVVS